MTIISKPLQRRTRDSYRVLYASESRPIVVSVMPGDLLGFREHGRREVFTLPIETAFKLSVRMKANAKAQAKRDKKKGIK